MKTLSTIILSFGLLISSCKKKDNTPAYIQGGYHTSSEITDSTVEFVSIGDDYLDDVFPSYYDLRIFQGVPYTNSENEISVFLPFPGNIYAPGVINGNDFSFSYSGPLNAYIGNNMIQMYSELEFICHHFLSVDGTPKFNGSFSQSFYSLDGILIGGISGTVSGAKIYEVL